MSKKRQASTGEKSVSSVVIGIVLVIAVLGWGCLATAFDGARPLADSTASGSLRGGRGLGFLIRGLIVVGVTSVKQLPNFFAVISWNLRHRIWLVLGIIVLEACAILFGVGLKMMEGHVSDPYKKLRAKRKSQSEQEETLKSSRRKKRKKRSDEI